MSRAKFDRYSERAIRLARVDDLLASMSPVALKGAVRVCRDPSDDKFLELALAGRADFLLTSDADLLTLQNFRSTVILTPSAYLAL